MGMYTGLRCKVIIKPEYREEMKYLHEIDYEWEDSNLDFMKEYAEGDGRATFIPRGSLSYMPDAWEEDPRSLFSPATDGFDRKFDPETGLWTFQCSLKNYDDTIENFLDNVLSRITEEVIHLEYYYEEWSRSRMLFLDDGEISINLDPNSGVVYRPEEEDNSYGF